MHPLVYTSPVSKTEYLGGRFLAALILNALILLGVQAGSLLAVYLPGVNPGHHRSIPAGCIPRSLCFYWFVERADRDDSAVLGGRC